MGPNTFRFFRLRLFFPLLTPLSPLRFLASRSIGSFPQKLLGKLSKVLPAASFDLFTDIINNRICSGPPNFFVIKSISLEAASDQPASNGPPTPPIFPFRSPPSPGCCEIYLYECFPPQMMGGPCVFALVRSFIFSFDPPFCFPTLSTLLFPSWPVPDALFLF